MRQKIIVDVDTGIDDSLALLYLLASPDAELLGIASTAGNVGAAQVAANNLAWLDVCHAPQIEVARGAERARAVEFGTPADPPGPRGGGPARRPGSRRSRSPRS
ncbi:nucleoside hydrolase, partial [Nocardia farcinica]|uniref:nucleoside hydrolase n=1 Tax=Nocardia farcinica TaxID=37329 RepID=UPI002456FAB5